tara:strand:- start:241 stop:753 length:513 start_codon:yes stop_codon:yes gene_type:complete
VTHYRTCNGCILEGKKCERREALRDSIKGLGVTSIKFNCAARSPLYHTGQRVSFQWWALGEPDHYGECDSYELRFLGTVISETANGNAYVVKVDAGESLESDEDPLLAEDVFRNKDLIIKVKRRKMRPTGEPSVVACAVCAGIGPDSDRCFAGQEYMTPGPNALCAEATQ